MVYYFVFVSRLNQIDRCIELFCISSRLAALDCLVAMATQLGTSWLPLLAESVPFLAELLEDGDFRIEEATKDAIRKLEQILEEPLEKYF